MLRTKRYPTGYIQGQILSKLKKKGKIRFSDLISELGISKPVLSEHLLKLGTKKVIFSEKKGREKYYMLTKTAKKTHSVQLELLKSDFDTYMGISGLDYDESSKYYKTDGMLEMNVNKIGSFFLFCVIKSILTGKNWCKSTGVEELCYSTFESFFSDIFRPKLISEEIMMLILNGERPVNFKKIKKVCKELGIESKIEKSYEILKQNYPIDVNRYEIMIQNPLAKGTSYLKL
ncbi:MAG: winged helix-turn-helix transcriptional regulator [Nitrosopumilus sp.]|nr:winged helix-turn-helix transcriptional regulator [Nitrosopumilus sp.]